MAVVFTEKLQGVNGSIMSAQLWLTGVYYNTWQIILNDILSCCIQSK